MNSVGRAGAEVRRRVGHPRDVLGLGGRHGEADRCHGSSLREVSGGQEMQEGKGGDLIMDWLAVLC